MGVNPACIIHLPKGEKHYRGMEKIKQVLMSMVVVMIAAGILTGMVIYSVSVMRNLELEILTGERIVASQGQNEILPYFTAD